MNTKNLSVRRQLNVDLLTSMSTELKPTDNQDPRGRGGSGGEGGRVVGLCFSNFTPGVSARIVIDTEFIQRRLNIV